MQANGEISGVACFQGPQIESHSEQQEQRPGNFEHDDGRKDLGHRTGGDECRGEGGDSEAKAVVALQPAPERNDDCHHKECGDESPGARVAGAREQEDRDLEERKDGRPHIEAVEMAEECERIDVLQGPRQAETADAILGHVPLGKACAADSQSHHRCGDA